MIEHEFDVRREAWVADPKRRPVIIAVIDRVGVAATLPRSSRPTEAKRAGEDIVMPTTSCDE
jgi:hypothetical protein